MPVITMTIGQGQITSEQKKTLIRSFTKSAVEVTTLPDHTFITRINELADDCIGVGGRTLADMKQAGN